MSSTNSPSPAARKALVGRRFWSEDPMSRETPKLGSVYEVISCGPKRTKVANVTFGSVDGADALWHHDAETPRLLGVLLDEQDTTATFDLDRPTYVVK